MPDLQYTTLALKQFDKFKKDIPVALMCIRQAIYANLDKKTMMDLFYDNGLDPLFGEKIYNAYVQHIIIQKQTEEAEDDVECYDEPDGDDYA